MLQLVLNYAEAHGCLGCYFNCSTLKAGSDWLKVRAKTYFLELISDWLGPLYNLRSFSLTTN